MKNGFRAKVLMSFTVGMTLVILLLIVLCRFMLRPILVYDSKKTMENYANLVVDVYVGGSSTVLRTIDMIDSSYDIQTSVLTEKMEIVYNSSYDIYPNSLRMSLIEKWMQLYSLNKDENNAFCREVFDESDNLNRIIYIQSFGDNEYIVMSKVIKGIDQTVKLASFFVAVVGLIVGLVGVVMWSMLTKPFTTQMEKMSRITKNMSQLNFDEKINFESRDEIGLLSASIDEMSDELKNSIEKLQKDVERRKRLIRDISHELKTPVTTIRGYTENIQILSAGNERIEKYCSIMIEECEVIDNLVSEMLYMSKLEADGYVCEMKQFDVSSLFKSLRQRIENECSAVTVDFNFENATLFASEKLIERAVLNYILNAVKHRTVGTKIFVSGESEANKYTFSVMNYGEEIPQGDRESIWDVFYKKDKSRTRSDNSHGIGLSIVKQIAHLHSGKVWLKSDKEKTIFYLEIPKEQ